MAVKSAYVSEAFFSWSRTGLPHFLWTNRPLGEHCRCAEPSGNQVAPLSEIVGDVNLVLCFLQHALGWHGCILSSVLFPLQRVHSVSCCSLTRSRAPTGSFRIPDLLLSETWRLCMVVSLCEHCYVFMRLLFFSLLFVLQTQYASWRCGMQWARGSAQCRGEPWSVRALALHGMCDAVLHGMYINIVKYRRVMIHVYSTGRRYICSLRWGFIASIATWIFSTCQ